MFKFLLALPILFVASVAVGQTDFRPGYVVPLSGDTLRGQVDYRGAQRSALLCHFRPSAASSVTEYTPQQLLGYGFTNSKLYEVHTVERVNEQSEPIFLEILVKGKASLYFLRDKGKDRFFLGTTTELQELLETSEKVYQDGHMYVQKQPLFRKVLATSFQDCPSQQASLNEVLLNASDLVRAVQRYNACVSSEQQVSAMAVPSSRSRLTLGLLAGAEAVDMKISGPLRFKNGQYDYGIFPVIGLALQATVPALNERLSVLLEGVYERIKLENTFIENYPSANYYYEQQTRFTLAYLRVPLLIRYAFPRGKLRPFVQVGISNSYAVTLETELRDRSATTTSYSAWRPAFAEENTRRYEQGLVGGIGLTTAQLKGRDVALELRAERGNGFSAVSGIPVHLHRFYALLRYDLTK